MKKTILLFVSMLLTIIGVSDTMAQTYDNVAGTLSWTVGNETTATTTEAITAAVQSTTVSVGTDLAVSPSAEYTSLGLAAGTYVCYQPTTGNPGCVATDMIEYTVKMKKGITFKPTSAEFDAVKDGTDNAYFSWSYTVDGTEGNITTYSDPKTQIRRNNNANPNAPLTHTEAVTADGGRTVTLRFYISNVANNKKMCIGNIKITGTVSGTETVRTFNDFKIDFRKDPYTVMQPADGLPAGIDVTGTFHDSQHGYQNAIITVPVDGPVKLTIGGCQYSNQATVTDAAGNKLATINTQSAGCDNNTSLDHYATWVYNDETATTLTIDCGSYCPFVYVEASELLPMVDVKYFDTDGTTLIGTDNVQGGSALKYKYSASDVTVTDGTVFRGWFNSPQASALKVAEGTSLQKELSLYARATAPEEPTKTSRYVYNINNTYFYDEDHEAIDMTGAFHDNQHGWAFSNGQTIKVKVAGKAYISLGCCLYTDAAANATVTAEDGTTVTSFTAKAETDGAEKSFQYDGGATTLTITFDGTTYIHKVAVYNVVDFLEYNETTGYYRIAPNDVSSFLLALTDANGTGNRKIYLPNGTYDLGETSLTSISGNNISIIGESMEGTIIKNAPPVENEGIGTTATLLNTSDGLYMQDLTIQNALDYYASGSAGRAVCLQDKGANTICKNVKMLSYQDTYYSNKASNFYWEDSEIHGTVDYLCGDGNVVYNRVKLVNESRSKDGKTGSNVVCAPNNTATTETRYNWGYVFLDCTIESLCQDFTFARSWGGESKATFINTKGLDGSLNAARFTTGGMNVAASAFKEYNTMDANGNVISPSSNIMTFTHSSGNKTYETILTKDEAAAFTIAGIYGTWAPDVTASQVSTTSAYLSEDKHTVSWTAVEGSTAYLVSINNEAGVLTEGKSLTIDGDITKATIRSANSRGGFGPTVSVDATGVKGVQVSESTKGSEIYNLSGMKVKKDYQGIVIKDGVKGLQ